MIYLRDISLHFGARTLFDHINLAIRPGEKIGLIGRNGSGKSTLLKLLSGQISADDGSIEIPAETQIGYLSQTVDLDLNRTPLEICEQAFAELTHIEMELSRVQEALEKSSDPEEQTTLAGHLSHLFERHALLGAEQRSGEIEKVLRGMGFSEDGFNKPLQTYSGGWRMRVELSQLLLTQPDLLLLDEPTNHLDIESILWFIQYLKTFDGTVLVVSHDQHFLDQVTRRTLEIELRQVRDYPYSYHKAMSQKQEMRVIQEAAFENQQRQVAHKEQLIDKFRAKASKAKFAKALQKELERMERIELEDTEQKSMKLRFQEGQRSGKVVYRITHLCKAFGAKNVITDLDLTIDRGSRIAFVGQNGQGKTTLARILAGKLTPDSGVIETGVHVECGYYAQDQPDLIPSGNRVIDVIREAAPTETEGRLRSVLGGMLFSGDDVDKKCSVLSGGERSRLSFACMLLTPSNVLILDEPTNHLDIQSKEILKQALMAYTGTLIVVSHDVSFLEGLTTHTLEFRDGGIHYHLYDITEFLAQHPVEDLKELERRSTVEESISPREKPKAASGREARMLQRQIQNIERSIQKLEEEKATLEEELSASDFYALPNASERTALYERITKAFSDKMREWEALVVQYSQYTGA